MGLVYVCIPLIRSISSSPSFIICMKGCYGPYFSFRFISLLPFLAACVCVCEYVFCLFYSRMCSVAHNFQQVHDYTSFFLIVSVYVFLFILSYHSFFIHFSSSCFLHLLSMFHSADGLHMCCVRTRARTHEHLYIVARAQM